MDSRVQLMSESVRNRVLRRIRVGHGDLSQCQSKARGGDQSHCRS